MEQAKHDYRNYSEIDYLLGSDLADTPWGVERFLQRLPLFDKHKRHIPYLLLLHLIYYNDQFPEEQKPQVLKNLLVQLQKDVIKGSEPNQLFNFIPPYYCLQLLIDLHISGYNVSPLIRNLEIETGSDPFRKLLEYGDCSIQGFPEALVYFGRKLEPHWRKKDRLLLDIGIACLRANNFHGFNFLYKNMKDVEIKKIALDHEVMTYVERNEMDKAFRIINSVNPPEENDVMYLDMAIILARQGKIDILREIKRTATIPEQIIGTLCGMMAYYLNTKDIPSALTVLGEAFEVLEHIKNRFTQTIRRILLIDFAFQCEKTIIVEKGINDVVFSIDHLLKKDSEKTVAKQFLLRKLISHKRIDQAHELNIKWNKPSTEGDPFWVQQNRDVELQVIIELELRAVSVYRRHDHLFGHQRKENAEEYYDTAFEAARMLSFDDYRAESLFIIAKHMAKSGLYEQARVVKADILVEDFHNPFDTSLPLYALSRGDIIEAMEFTKHIREEKERTAVLLCMAPHMEKRFKKAEARSFLREWAVTIFQ